ncbi:fumarylacetoacetate hydrolase family protein [Kribbella sp. NPDC058245]|uniref:fumarylacetoacetate hydrolase family protein n=1 Tax=Kribbella sp. NPDC058245 TaxID=3346399 RepID=UPI0036E3E4B9
MRYVMVADGKVERPGVLEGDSVLLLVATDLSEVAGIGNAREPQVFLQDGDVVVTRADKLGELRNRVVLV